MTTEPVVHQGICSLWRKSSKIHCGVKGCALLVVCMFCVSCAGKSSSERLREVEFTTQENQSNIAEVSHRVSALESRMDSLSGEVGQINARTYEVRTKSGRKTGMTVHPVMPPAPAVPVNPAGVVQGAGAVPPQVVSALEPAPTPQKPKAPLPPLSDVPPPMTMPGQKQQATRGNASAALSLPPSEAVTMVVPEVVPAVHVPLAPQDSLSLPPESAAAPAVNSVPQAAARSTAPAAQAVSTAKLPAAAKGEEGAYKAALSLVTSGRPTEGRQKFQEFLQAYPSGRYAANAYYWIGESYYAQGNYSEALLSFKQVSTQFPRHHKTADALLKAGMTYQKLGDRENAQLQYKALQSDFPNSEAAGRVRRSGR